MQHINIGQTTATVESRIPYAHNTVRDKYACQASTTVEHITTYTRVGGPVISIPASH